jgi:hypothetical protein
MPDCDGDAYVPTPCATRGGAPYVICVDPPCATSGGPLYEISVDPPFAYARAYGPLPTSAGTRSYAGVPSSVVRLFAGFFFLATKKIASPIASSSTTAIGTAMAGMSQLSAAPSDSDDGEGASVSSTNSLESELEGSVGKSVGEFGLIVGVAIATFVVVVVGVAIAAFVVVVVVAAAVICGGGGGMGVIAGRGGGTGVIAGRGADRVVGSVGSEQTHSMSTQPQFNPSGRHWDAMHDWPFAIVMNDNASNAATKQNIFGFFNPSALASPMRRCQKHTPPLALVFVSADQPRIRLGSLQERRRTVGALIRRTSPIAIWLHDGAQDMPPMRQAQSGERHSQLHRR